MNLEHKLEETYDFIITDLGLYYYKDKRSLGRCQNPYAGLEMISDLAYLDNCKLPTIIYSKTEIPSDWTNSLKDCEIPFLLHAKNIDDLEFFYF